MLHMDGRVFTKVFFFKTAKGMVCVCLLPVIRQFLKAFFAKFDFSDNSCKFTKTIETINVGIYRASTWVSVYEVSTFAICFRCLRVNSLCKRLQKYTFTRVSGYV